VKCFAVVHEREGLEKETGNSIKFTQGSSLRVQAVVNLGNFRPDNPEITADVLVSNTGNSLIHLLGMKGSCSCFKGGDFPKVLKPEEKAKIKLHFDPKVFSGSAQVA